MSINNVKMNFYRRFRGQKSYERCTDWWFGTEQSQKVKVRLCVCLSVCHTRDLCQNDSNKSSMFWTTTQLPSADPSLLYKTVQISRYWCCDRMSKWNWMRCWLLRTLSQLQLPALTWKCNSRVLIVTAKCCHLVKTNTHFAPLENCSWSCILVTWVSNRAIIRLSMAASIDNNQALYATNSMTTQKN